MRHSTRRNATSGLSAGCLLFLFAGAYGDMMPPGGNFAVPGARDFSGNPGLSKANPSLPEQATSHEFHFGDQVPAFEHGNPHGPGEQPEPGEAPPDAGGPPADTPPAGSPPEDTPPGDAPPGDTPPGEPGSAPASPPAIGLTLAPEGPGSTSGEDVANYALDHLAPEAVSDLDVPSGVDADVPGTHASVTSLLGVKDDLAVDTLDDPLEAVREAATSGAVQDVIPEPSILVLFGLGALITVRRALRIRV